MARHIAQLTDQVVGSVAYVRDDSRLLVAPPSGDWLPIVEGECSPNDGLDESWPDKWAPVWDATAATVVDEFGDWAHTVEGEIVFHAGQHWRNLLPDGTPNVWEPGVANWRSYPLTGHPDWSQPTGAGDAYDVGDVVRHRTQPPQPVYLLWESTIPANTTEPGTDGDLDRWWTPGDEVP